MGKEVMRRKASDNEYLHKDFHNLMNVGIEYLREHFGEEAVREYLRQFVLSFYAPLKIFINVKGISSIMEHNREIYIIENALDDVEFSLSNDELIIRVGKCPAVEHMIKSGVPISPLYVETTKTVNETICEGTPFAFELLEYDDQTGASVQRFYRKGE